MDHLSFKQQHPTFALVFCSESLNIIPVHVQFTSLASYSKETETIDEIEQII